MNKASDSNGIPAEVFKTLKDDAVKMRHSMSASLYLILVGLINLNLV